MSYKDFGYTDSTSSAIVDAKIVIDRLIENDEFYHLLNEVGVELADMRTVQEILDGIMKEQHLSYDMKSGFSDEFVLEHWSQTDDALKAVRNLLSSIEDPEFWSEQEYAMNDIMDVFNERCGINY